MKNKLAEMSKEEITEKFIKIVDILKNFNDDLNTFYDNSLGITRDDMAYNFRNIIKSVPESRQKDIQDLIVIAVGLMMVSEATVVAMKGGPKEFFDKVEGFYGAVIGEDVKDEAVFSHMVN